LSLVVTYAFYWSGSWLFGPRYYYEGLFSLTLLSAAGIRAMAGYAAGLESIKFNGKQMQHRFPLTAALVVILMMTNLLYYLPARAATLTNLYGASRSDLALFSTPQALAATPALVFVHADNWNDYHPLLELSNAYLDSPFLIAYSQGEAGDLILASQYPRHTVLHYYPDTPDRFFFALR